MALFPTKVFTKTNVKAAWKASYTTENINSKFNGIPRGVYYGFDPAPNTLDPVNKLDLNLSSIESASRLRVRSSGGTPVTVDLDSQEVVTLDFTGHVSFPVYVVGKANYEVGKASTASIVTQSAPANGVTEIGICKINSLPLNGLGAIEFDAAPNRHTPIANTGVEIGFMTGGAEQDRQAANAVVAEVIAARTDCSTTHPSLAARLSAVANCLAKSLDVVQSKVHVGVVGTNHGVSEDFANTARTAEGINPLLTIPGGGSESSNGAITDPTDTVRNLVVVQEVARNRRLIDEVTGLPVFGRLVLSEVAIVGNLVFSTASQAVVASVSQTGVIAANDIILGGDGNYYKVQAIDGPGTGITLAIPYAGVGGAFGSLIRRRFTVNLVTRSGGADSAYTVVREASILPSFAVGTRFQAGETITYNGKTATVVRDTPEGSATLHYIPTVATDLILGSETIVGGTSGAQVNAAAGTPTVAAPDLRFFYPVFTPLDIERFSALNTMMSSLVGRERAATEVIEGIMRFAVDGGTDAFTAVQANDSRMTRIPSSDQFDALLGAGATPPSASNLYVLEDNPGVFDPDYLHANANSVSAGTVQWSPVQQSGATFSIAAGVITINTPGVYLINVAINSGGGAGFTPILRRNGVATATASTTDTAAESLAMTAIMVMGAGNQITVTISSGTMSATLTDNNITVVRIA